MAAEAVLRKDPVMDRPPAVGVPVIPIDALFGEYYGPSQSGDAQGALREAAVVIGVDVMTGRAFLV